MSIVEQSGIIPRDDLARALMPSSNAILKAESDPGGYLPIIKPSPNVSMKLAQDSRPNSFKMKSRKTGSSTGISDDSATIASSGIGSARLPQSTIKHPS